MLQYYAKKSFNEDPKPVKEPPMERAWIYGACVTPDELTHITERYGLDAGIVKDVRDKHELPRLEYSQGLLYVFIRAPRTAARGSVATVPFLAILKGSLLLTLSTKEYVKPEELFAQTTVDMKSTRHVFLQLIDYVIAQYQTSIRLTGKYVLNTSQRLSTHDVDNKDFINFVTVEHDLNEYRTNLTALEALLQRLQENRHALFSEKDCEFIEDSILHVDQLLVATQSHQSTIESIRNAYTTISNNTLNLRMKKLTLLTLLIALPNVFFGMYGMNVALPIQTEPWAYPVIMVVSLGIVVLVALFIRRIRF